MPPRAVGRFDVGVDDVGFDRRDGEADAAQFLAREPVVTLVQVLPPSVVRWMALSGPPSISVQKCRRR